MNYNPGRSILYKTADGKYSTTAAPQSKPTVVKNLYGCYTTAAARNTIDTTEQILREDLWLTDSDSATDIHPNFWDPEDFLIIDEC